ncbi:MAG: hypothetical protein LBF09_00610, partial [Odoribacteraceae bacterium]|nr:hypothetical protein [Odoribacteraceae bacterium]
DERVINMSILSGIPDERPLNICILAGIPDERFLNASILSEASRRGQLSCRETVGELPEAGSSLAAGREDASRRVP